MFIKIVSSTGNPSFIAVDKILQIVPTRADVSNVYLVDGTKIQIDEPAESIAGRVIVAASSMKNN